MREFSWKGIEFSALKFNDSVDQMINIMQENYDNDFMRMTVMDLTEAVETESREEIDHMVAEYAMMDVQRMMMKPRGGF